jgi:hypothetical protein
VAGGTLRPRGPPQGRSAGPAGALFQPGLRADGIPPRCSGDYTQPPTFKATPARPPSLRTCGQGAERWQGFGVEGHRDGPFAPPGGTGDSMALLVAVRAVRCRMVATRAAWVIRQGSVNRAAVPTPHPAMTEPAWARRRIGRHRIEANHNPGDVSAPSGVVAGLDDEPPWLTHRPTEVRHLPRWCDRQTGERPRPGVATGGVRVPCVAPAPE